MVMLHTGHKRRNGQTNGGHVEPRDESTLGTGALNGETAMGPTLARSNREGTICDVHGHGATHVGCETSSEESIESPMGWPEDGDNYPWLSARHVNTLIERELQQQQTEWTIDIPDGAGSFEELKLEPLPRIEAGH